MKSSFIIGTLSVVGAAVIGAGATFATQPYTGSDTLYDLTNQALALSTLGNVGDYVGGGSNTGEGAMAAASPKQHTAPMTSMLTTTSCNAPSNGRVHASGIVIGLDAVDVYSSVFAGGATACNGTADNTGTGLNYDAAVPDAAADGGPAVFLNWTDALALLYGGLDKSTGVTDCGSSKRRALVANWSNLFENHCSNGVSTCTTASFNSTTLPNGGFHIGGQLWHALRRDDGASTTSVFAALIGLGQQTDLNGVKTIKPSVSSSANNGFGSSPFCNVINWDTTAANAGCALGAGKQFLGPGGVAQGVCSASGNTNLCDVVGAVDTFADGTTCTAPGTTDPVSGSCSVCNCVAIDSSHRRPPYLTWGTVADGSVTNPISGQTNAAAVLPTSYQDNDPIRRPCLGLAGDITDNPGEEVCNRDGTLGVVLPVPSVDFVPKNFGGRDPFPGVANACGGNSAGTNTFDVFSCALIAGPAGRAAGGCPNGDTTFGGGCIAATGLDNTNTLCYAAPTDNQVLGNYTTYDGRIYNLTLTNGTNGYTTVTIPVIPANGVSGAALGLAFVGDYGRIHAQTVLWDKTAGSTGLADKGVPCVQQAADDQVGCLVQADPCSLTFGSDTDKTWGSRHVPAVASNIVPLRVSQIAPTTATVQSGTYLFWRKLYFNASQGFDTLAAQAAVDAGPAAELSLAQYESNTTSITSLLDSYSFFRLGASSPTGTDTPFCEDYNEQLLCDAGITNQNACNLNAGIGVRVPPGGNAAAFSPIPSDPSPSPTAATVSTVCGNGIKEVFEDCDNGLANGTTGNNCTTTCRFVFK
jgi:hypothetical protein